jgi:hypothetical protein
MTRGLHIFPVVDRNILMGTHGLLGIPICIFVLGAITK